MKKIICLILCMMMISGCSSHKNDSTFFLPIQDNEYSMYNQDGEVLTSKKYIDYKENHLKGYVVTYKDNQVGYIDYNGKELIKPGVHQYFQINDQMVIGSQQEIKNELKEGAIYNSEGKKLYQLSDSTVLRVSELPILNHQNQWQVLYQDGEDLYKGNEEVFSSMVLGNAYILFFKDYINVYYDNQITKIEMNGDFSLSDSNDDEAILFDKKNKNAIYIHLKDKKYTIYRNIEADCLELSHGNILLKKDDTISILSKTVQSFIMLNSYYKDINHYIVRNSIYGPHNIINQSKNYKLEDLEVEPVATYISGEIYPVYKKDKGYEYYDFSAKKVIDHTYYQASLFDKNNIAIVSDKENKYYLINNKGETITDETYFDIKYIGSSYYAVYNGDGMFGIIDDQGEEKLPIEYTGIEEKCLYEYQDKQYLLLDKNGSGYLYDTSDFDVVFSKEGDVRFNEKGYISVDEYRFYTLDGEVIH